MMSGKENQIKIALIDFISSCELGKTNTSSLGIASIKGVLDANQIPNKIIRIPFSLDSITQAKQELREVNPEYIGIPLLSKTYPIAKALARRIKESIGLPILVGGHLPTVLPKDVLEDCRDFDFAFIGEAELELSKFLQGEECNGIAYRESDSVKIKLNKEPIDINKLPFPSPEYLLEGAINGGGVIPLEIQRGCGYRKCIFCDISAFYSKGYERLHYSRYKSIENILKEVRYWENRNINCFALRGDNLLGDRDQINTFITEIEKSKKQVIIGLTTRADEIVNNYDTVERLQKSKYINVGGISIGFESNTQHALDLLKKGTTPEINYQAMEIIKRLNKKYGKETKIFYNFILFPHPDMTLEDLIENIKFAAEYIPNSQSLYPALKTVPFPGTEIWHKLKKQGYIANPENGFTCNYVFNDEKVQRAFTYFRGRSKDIKPLFVCKEIYNASMERKIGKIISNGRS